MNEANSEPDRPPRSLDTGALAKGAMLGAIVTAGFLLVVGVLVYRQSVPRLTQQEFESAAKRWSEHRPANYDCEIEIFGNRPGKVQVEVRNGQVEKMTRDGQTPAARRTWEAWTVEGMFDTIERELEIAEHPEQAVGGTSAPLLYARFDDKLGYPVVFRRSVPGAQQDMAWNVTRFEVLK